ncbi:MAG: tetratricopeptide repeat protein [Geitlerinemataceae cyanobacterium]
MEGLEASGRYQIVRNISPPDAPRPLYYACDFHMPVGAYCAIEKIDLRSASPSDYLDVVGEVDRDFQRWLNLHYENPAIPRPLSRFDCERVLYRAIALDSRTLLSELGIAEFGGVCAFLQASLEMLAWVHAQGCIHGHLRLDTLVCQPRDASSISGERAGAAGFTLVPLACGHLVGLDGTATVRDDLSAIAAIATHALAKATEPAAEEDAAEIYRFLEDLHDPGSKLMSARHALEAFGRRSAGLRLSAAPPSIDGPDDSLQMSSEPSSATVWPRHSRISTRPALRSRQLLAPHDSEPKVTSAPVDVPTAGLASPASEAASSDGAPPSESEARYSVEMHRWYVEGLEARDRGDLALAVTALDRAVALNAGTRDRDVGLARLCRSRAPILQCLGRNAAALSDYRTAIEAAPDDLRLSSDYGRLLLEMGRAEEALVMFERLRTAFPNLAQPAYWQGRTLAKLADRQGAMAAYRTACELGSHSGELFLCLGLALEALGCSDEAIAAYERSSSEPWKGVRNSPLADYRLGLLLPARDSQGAIACFDRAIAALERLTISETQQLPDLADPRWPTWTSDDPYADLWQARAARALEAGHDREALADLERACERRPNDSELWRAKARACSSLGQHEESAIAAHRAACLQPNDPQYWHAIAAAISECGARELAELCHRKAGLFLDRSPLDRAAKAELWHARSRNLLQLDRPAEARTYARRAIACDPQRADLHAWMGSLCDRGECDECAHRHYDRWAHLAPRDPEAWLHVSALESRRNRPESALKAARRALDIAPLDARAWYLCGEQFRQQYRYGLALYHFQQAIARDRSHALSRQACHDLRWYRACDRAIALLPARYERRLKQAIRRRLPLPDRPLVRYLELLQHTWQPFLRVLGRVVF